MFIFIQIFNILEYIFVRNLNMTQTKKYFLVDVSNTLLFSAVTTSKENHKENTYRITISAERHTYKFFCTTKILS